MLTDLSIKNIAIIENLSISLHSGFTVLTGETGAGKSIIIDAVGLIMGGRTSSEMIRTGADEGVVEALFDISGSYELKALVSEHGFECDKELLVKRIISRNGKNRIFINGSIATLSILSALTSKLINIYGQHESQTLLKPENQLFLLDAFAGAEAARKAYTAVYKELLLTAELLANLDEESRETARRIDLLKYQSDEIASAALKPDEERELEEKRLLLANADRLVSVATFAFERLYDGNSAILGELRRISSSINDAAKIDQTLGELSLAVENSYLQLEDAAISLRDYSARIDTDPKMLQDISDRIDLVNRMKRKYGTTLEEVLAYGMKIKDELEALFSRNLDRNRLEEKKSELETKLLELGKTLSDLRKEGGAELKRALENEVHQLAMKNAVIDPALIPLSEPSEKGMERVEFLFSPNPGEVPRALSRIASGGELSRLMLAMKQVLPEGAVPTLVFDEVDAGIGGHIAELVGRKLKKVAGRHQVFCITHLPQVAVFADHHLKVEKIIEKGRTTTEITRLDQSSRTEEIARMLGGAEITSTTRQHAAEMLEAATAAGI